MTMPTPNHPDDELLAALAASEPDVAEDVSLAAHLVGCERCTRIVDELRSLRSALAALPDVPPSRPLQFLPAVAEAPVAPANAGWVGLLRRATAPLMGAAAALILVGAIGTAANSGVGAAGSTTSLSKEGAAAASAAASTTSDAQGPAASSVSAVPGRLGGSSATPNAASESGRNTFDNGSTARATPAPGTLASSGASSTRPPFEWLLGAGVVLLALTLLGRAYVRRRDPPEPA